MPVSGSPNNRIRSEVYPARSPYNSQLAQSSWEITPSLGCPMALGSGPPTLTVMLNVPLPSEYVWARARDPHSRMTSVASVDAEASSIDTFPIRTALVCLLLLSADFATGERSPICENRRTGVDRKETTRRIQNFITSHLSRNDELWMAVVKPPVNGEKHYFSENNVVSSGRETLYICLDSILR